MNGQKAAQVAINVLEHDLCAQANDFHRGLTERVLVDVDVFQRPQLVQIPWQLADVILADV